MNQVKISPAEGRLGILVVGCGAVATTFITGVPYSLWSWAIVFSFFHGLDFSQGCHQSKLQKTTP